MSADQPSPFWAEWEKKVLANRENYAASPLYVEQMSQPEEEFRAVAETVTLMGQVDPDGKTRDAQFGGRLVDTCLGPVTRMWLDSNVEYHFLKRHLPNLYNFKVLDIGAGYGRFAATLSQFVSSVTTVDAIPISTEVSREYLAKFAPTAKVLSMQEFKDQRESLSFDLAINIHSWNECTMEQVENWLYKIVELKIPYLFTVSHGQLDAKIEKAYYTWEIGFPSFRPALERYYDLVAEESLGLTNHPHALWKLKEGAVPCPYVAPEKPLVWIATPLKQFAAQGTITERDFNTLAPHYRESVRAVSSATNLPWKFELCLVGGGGVARARNRIVADFLKSKAKYLFFKDYDLMDDPSGKDIVKILSRMEQHGFLVCGGMYTIRAENGHWVHNFPDGNGIKDGWALRVLELGTGFKCYKREAFEIIAEKNPWLKYEHDDTKETEWGFFSMGPVTDEKFWPGRARWLTEDYWLDWLTRDAGIIIVEDTTVQLRHLEESTGEIFPKEFPPLPEAIPEPKELEIAK